MDKQPLLSHPNRPSLLSLPEDGEVSIPISTAAATATPLTPSRLKDHLIFGPSPQHSSASIPNLVDVLTLSPSYSSSSSSTLPETPAPSPLEHLVEESSCLNSNNKSSKAYLHRSKTAPATSVINELNRHHPSPPESHNRSRSVIRQAFLLLSIYLSVGVIIYLFNRDSFRANETHPIVDALYFCIVTMCTIGYGDITPDSSTTKVFSILFVLVGFGFIDILLSGMVGYALDLQESYMLNAVKQRNEEKKSGRAGASAGSYIVDVNKGRMRIRIKVALALGVVVLCICVGAMVMHHLERLGWLDSFYLSVMSVTTVGYGDRTFNSMVGRVFASVWLLVSTLAVARAFLYLAEARVDKRQRRMVKWVLGHDMTVAEFLAADIDNNGFVSKSEYVIYKLKEMGKVSEKDILQICDKFDKLDTGNYGKISLADLMRSGP